MQSDLDSIRQLNSSGYIVFRPGDIRRNGFGFTVPEYITVRGDRECVILTRAQHDSLLQESCKLRTAAIIARHEFTDLEARLDAMAKLSESRRTVIDDLRKERDKCASNGLDAALHEARKEVERLRAVEAELLRGRESIEEELTEVKEHLANALDIAAYLA